MTEEQLKRQADFYAEYLGAIRRPGATHRWVPVSERIPDREGQYCFRWKGKIYVLYVVPHALNKDWFLSLGAEWLEEVTAAPGCSVPVPLPASLNFEGYDPVSCDHKLSDGLTAVRFFSREQDKTGNTHIDRFFCTKCGSVRVFGFRTKNGECTHIDEGLEFYHPDAVAAIIKYCNWIHRENNEFDPFIRLSEAPRNVRPSPAQPPTEALAEWLKRNKEIRQAYFT